MSVNRTVASTRSGSCAGPLCPTSVRKRSISSRTARHLGAGKRCRRSGSSRTCAGIRSARSRPPRRGPSGRAYREERASARGIDGSTRADVDVGVHPMSVRAPGLALWRTRRCAATSAVARRRRCRTAPPPRRAPRIAAARSSAIIRASAVCLRRRPGDSPALTSLAPYRRRAPRRTPVRDRSRRTGRLIARPPTGRTAPPPRAGRLHDRADVVHARLERGSAATRSEIPVPRLSKWISRENEDSRSKKARTSAPPTQLHVRDSAGRTRGRRARRPTTW